MLILSRKGFKTIRLNIEEVLTRIWYMQNYIPKRLRFKIKILITHPARRSSPFTRTCAVKTSGSVDTCSTIYTQWKREHRALIFVCIFNEITIIKQCSTFFVSVTYLGNPFSAKFIYFSFFFYLLLTRNYLVLIRYFLVITKKTISP